MTNEISWSHRKSSNPNRPAVPGRIQTPYPQHAPAERG
jgi:hypothetical protein